jgi:hypothetical protein
MKNLGQMQKMWSAIIATRNVTAKDFAVWWNKTWKIRRIRKVLQIQSMRPMTSPMTVRLTHMFFQFHQV